MAGFLRRLQSENLGLGAPGSRTLDGERVSDRLILAAAEERFGSGRAAPCWSGPSHCGEPLKQPLCRCVDHLIAILLRTIAPHASSLELTEKTVEAFFKGFLV